MLVGTDVCVRMVSCGRKPEYPEETHLSDQMTISCYNIEYT
mgnify:CR=1 FL=1